MLGVIQRVYQNNKGEISKAEITWSGNKLFKEVWFVSSLISAEDPCSMLKELL